jgi:hypothetical protein
MIASRTARPCVSSLPLLATGTAHVDARTYSGALDKAPVELEATRDLTSSGKPLAELYTHLAQGIAIPPQSDRRGGLALDEDRKTARPPPDLGWQTDSIA